MIGIVIVAHGGLAREYLAAVEHVVGKQTAIRTISIGPDDDRSAKQTEICAAADTVDTGDRSLWDFDPFCGDIRDEHVLGRGTVDQEGGAAAMITAGRILKELGYGGAFTIWFSFTVQEEDCDGMCWNYLIEEENLVPELAVSTEPTNLNLYRGHRGRMEFDVYFSGVSCHGSAPERGDNALYKAARTALEVEQLHERLASVDAEAAPAVAAQPELAADHAPGVLLHLEPDVQVVPAEGDHLVGPSAPVGAAEGQVVEGFQQVGLAFSISPEDKVDR